MQSSFIRIFYLHYNADRHEKNSRDPNKSRPDGFSYVNCFNNLLDTIRKSRFKDCIQLTIWFDGNSDDFNEDFISKIIPNDINIKVILAEFHGGSKSANALVNYIYQAPFNSKDLIYCLENDYSHQLGWIDKVIELAKSSIRFDYISLYDHADNYRLPIHQRMHKELYFTDSQIWKTALSSCWSFITKYETFCEDYSLLTSNDDFVLFVKLNAIGRYLLVPVPGLSSHGMRGYESPGVDWVEIRNLYNH